MRSPNAKTVFHGKGAIHGLGRWLSQGMLSGKYGNLSSVPRKAGYSGVHFVTSVPEKKQVDFWSSLMI